MRLKTFLLLLVLSISGTLLSTQAQTLHLLEQSVKNNASNDFTSPQYIPQNRYAFTLPIGLIVTGITLMNRIGWLDFNLRVREQLRYRNYKARYVDDVLQFVPMAGAVALDLYRWGRTREYQPLVESASSIALMLIVVHSVKFMHFELRPDNSTWNSFPSGHTAAAFVGAELLRQKLPSEYWYLGVVGYAAAATTAYLRIYHNRHWLGDTLAGAGIGILSAWLGSNLTRLCFQHHRER